VVAKIDAPRRLVQRYGVEAPAVLALAAGDPALLEPVAPGVPVTGAEFVWGVRHEGAFTEEDLLDRRTRIGLVAADRAPHCSMPAVPFSGWGAHRSTCVKEHSNRGRMAPLVTAPLSAGSAW
jgi:glycerol-3-phosphate dehydrogenase